MTSNQAKSARRNQMIKNACAALFAALVIDAAPCVAAELTMQQINLKDWANGEWKGYNKGSTYAELWSWLSGHGYWDGDDVMAAGYTYVIPKDKALRMGGTKVDPFPGDLLVLKGSSMYITYSPKDFGPSPIRIDGAKAQIISYNGAGSQKDIMTSDRAANFSGPIQLNIAATDQLLFGGGQRHTGQVLSGKITGAGTFKIYTYNIANKGYGSATDYLNITNVLCRDRLEITGDTSEAKIDIEINPGNRLVLGSDIAQQVWIKEMGSVSGDPARTPYNGSVFSVSAADRTPKIGTLKLGNYVSLEVPVATDAVGAGYVTVTNKIVFTKAVSSEDLVIKVLLRTKPYELRNGEERKLPILKLAAGATGTIDPANFEYCGTLDSSSADFARFETESDATGTTLYAVFEALYPVVMQENTMTGSTTKIYPSSWADETSVTVSGTNCYFWEDHQPIRAGYEYYAHLGVRMPRGEFPGERLTLPRGCYAIFNWGERLEVDEFDKTCTVGDFVITGNGNIGIWASSPSRYRQYAVLDGKMTILNDGKVCVYINENRRQGLRIKSKLVGSAKTQLVLSAPTSIDETRPIDPEYQRPDMRLEGDCSAFHGTFTVKTNALGGVVSFPGTLVAEGGSIVGSINAATMAVLKTGDIRANVTLSFPCDPANGTAGSLTFTNACTIGSNCTIRPEGTFRPFSGDELKLTLLTVPDDGVSTVLTPEMFNYDFSKCTKLSSAARSFSVEKANGYAKLVMTLHKRGLVLLLR